jgi:hypothetical protein
VLFNTGSGLLNVDQFPVHAPVLRPGELPQPRRMEDGR